MGKSDAHGYPGSLHQGEGDHHGAPFLGPLLNVEYPQDRTNRVVKQGGPHGTD